MRKIELACIIDDDPVYVFGVRKMMELSDFCENFLIFHNGKEAIDKFQAILESGKNLPKIILLDLNMPVMDGWEFLDEFIKIPTPDVIHIYIVSSSIDPTDIERATHYQNVSNYLVKPIKIDQLKDILTQVV